MKKKKTEHTEDGRPAESAKMGPCMVCGCETSRIEKKCFFHTYSRGHRRGVDAGLTLMVLSAAGLWGAVIWRVGTGSWGF